MAYQVLLDRGFIGLRGRTGTPEITMGGSGADSSLGAGSSFML